MLTDYFSSISKLQKDPSLTYEAFFDMLPGEYTKNKDQFRSKLIEQSRFLEKTGIESRPDLRQ